MYTLFPPYMVAKQNAMIYSEGGKIYFNLSTFNTIDQVKHIQVAINRQDTNENALTSNALRYATGQYYIVDGVTGRPIKPIQVVDYPTSAAVYADNYPAGYMFIPVRLGETVIFDETKQLYYFNIPADILDSNVVYKVQIRFGKQEITTVNNIDWFANGVEINSAWLNNSENIRSLSEWSTVGIFTTLKSFSVSIQDFTSSTINTINTSVYDFVGRNNLSETNPNEIVSSVQFSLFKDDMEIETSGLIRQPSNQKQYSIYTFKTVFTNGATYKIAFTLNTKSNYSKTIVYDFTASYETLSASYGVSIDTNNTFLSREQILLNSTGVRLILHDISYKDLSAEDFNKRPNSYILRKTSSRSNFQEWEEVLEVRGAPGTSEFKYKFFDTFVESGVTYRYAVQSRLLNNGRGLVSDYIEFTPRYDYSWLIAQDSLHFNMSYNLDFSGFKTVIKETKIETIGGKYPIFVRNGNLRYKEFNLSTTITQEMDILDKLTDQNQDAYVEEREFRTLFVDMFMDGKPKVLKTSTEGLMLVYLSNVSLTPQRVLGRTIYDLSCTVTEIAECTLENLDKYGIVSLRPVSVGEDIRTPAITGKAITGLTVTGVY